MYDYFWKVNIAWLLFYIFYRLAGAGHTFFIFRRFFLLSIAVVAMTYPGWGGGIWAGVETDSEWLGSLWEWSGTAVSALEGGTAGVNYGAWIYKGGIFLLGIRFCIQLAGVFRLKRKGKAEKIGGMKVIVCDGPETAFSFFRWIFIGRGKKEGLRNILLHEKAHVEQWHFIDILLWEGICIGFWYNPAVWLLRSAVRENLEFLADRQVLSTGCDRREYQYLLLDRSLQGAGIWFGSYFNARELKRRIGMMNRKTSSGWCLLKYVLFVPWVGMLMWVGDTQAFNPWNGKISNLAVEEEKSAEGAERIPLVIIDGKQQPAGYDFSDIKSEQIESITVLKGQKALEKFGEAAAGGVIELKLKKKLL